MSRAALERAEKAVIGEIWTSDLAYQNLLHLCDVIGNRFAGSASEHRGADFLVERAREYGLQDIGLHEYPFTGWSRGPVRLEITSPVTRELTAIALPYTPCADLEGEAIWVGEGEEEDFQRIGDGLAGKIAVSAAETSPGPGKRSSHRREKFARAIAAGATAFLFVNQNPGGLAITGSLAAGFPAEIPGIGLPKESGEFIVRMLARGPVRLRLKIEGSFYETVSKNVLGQVGPTDQNGDFLLTGAHYDAHDIAVGALDNTAGTVVVLEAARALATVGDLLPMPIRVVFFAGEEIGLVGAWNYASARQADLDRCRFVLNVDSCSTGTPGSENLGLCGFPDLVPYFEALGKKMAYAIPVKDSLSAYSDHFPFAMAGVPNASMGSRDTSTHLVGRGWGHTAADTVDKVNPKSLQASAMSVARLLLRVAFEEEWPASHRTREDMVDTVAKSPIGWYVEKFGRYPFQPK